MNRICTGALARVMALLFVLQMQTQSLAGTASDPHSQGKPVKRPVVRICVGNEDWFPFSYMDGKKPVGVHVDLATMAAKAAGFDAKFTAMAWQKCVNQASRDGRFDVPLSAAWRKERTDYLMYPAKAEQEGPKCESTQSLMCNGHIIVVPAGATVKFDGNLKNIPTPVRIIAGYNEVQDFRKKGLEVETGPDDETNLRKMLKDSTGSALMLVQSTHQFNSRPEFKNKFRIMENFEDYSDSFMPFSKKGKISQVDAEKIWAEITKLRKYPVVLDNAIKRHLLVRPGQLPSPATRAWLERKAAAARRI